MVCIIICVVYILCLYVRFVVFYKREWVLVNFLIVLRWIGFIFYYRFFGYVFIDLFKYCILFKFKKILRKFLVLNRKNIEEFLVLVIKLDVYIKKGVVLFLCIEY